MGSTIVSIIAFILIIGLLIFIHEFGHYIIAKKNGVGVVEFSIGMGPAIHSWVKNGTKYSLRWLPFGGYCQLLGGEAELPGLGDAAEDEENKIAADDEHAFSNKNVWARMSILLAGPAFNFILAFLLSLLVIAMAGYTPAKIGGIIEGYPAEESGLQKGDVITKIDNETMHFFKDITIYMTIHEKTEMKITYMRDGETYTTTLQPKYNEEEARYLIGIISPGSVSNLSFGEVLKYGTFEFGYNLGVVVKSFGMFFSGKASFNDLSGPVGMAGMVGTIVSEVEEDTEGEGFWVTAYWILVNLVSFAAMISANLGIVNLLPIPGLDGGKILFCLIEAVTGKPLPRKFEGVVTVIGAVLLLLLVIAVSFNDIRLLFVK